MARGVFFTEAELRAVPSRRRLARPPAPARRDPNDAPPSAEAKAVAASPGVCAWCGEPPDERSQLNAGAMHPECQAAWDTGRGQPYEETTKQRKEREKER
jgi:hypothetical protein